jgi:hypothetical protein
MTTERAWRTANFSCVACGHHNQAKVEITDLISENAELVKMIKKERNVSLFQGASTLIGACVLLLLGGIALQWTAFRIFDMFNWIVGLFIHH